jgi:nuclear pore complex protein Nup155
MANYARSFIGADSNAGASTFGSRQLAAPAPAPVVDLAALQSASNALQEQLSKDAQAVPDLGEMLTIRAPFVYCYGAS